MWPTKLQVRQSERRFIFLLFVFIVCLNLPEYFNKNALASALSWNYLRLGHSITVCYNTQCFFHSMSYNTEQT
jgi:hypothetical protein